MTCEVYLSTLLSSMNLLISSSPSLIFSCSLFYDLGMSPVFSDFSFAAAASATSPRMCAAAASATIPPSACFITAADSISNRMEKKKECSKLWSEREEHPKARRNSALRWRFRQARGNIRNKIHIAKAPSAQTYAHGEKKKVTPLTPQYLHATRPTHSPFLHDAQTCTTPVRRQELRTQTLIQQYTHTSCVQCHPSRNEHKTMPWNFGQLRLLATFGGDPHWCNVGTTPIRRNVGSTCEHVEFRVLNMHGANSKNKTDPKAIRNAEITVQNEKMFILVSTAKRQCL